MSFMPPTAECTEGIKFSLAIRPVDAVVIYSVTPSIVNNAYSDVRYYLIENVLYISGTYNDMFDRSISYIDINKVPVTVNRWGEIPEDFNAIYKFKAPEVEFIDQILTIRYLKQNTATPTDLTEVTENFILTIRHNWQSDATMVKNLAISGKYYKDAKLAGKAP